METTTQELLVTENLRVTHKIGLLNKYVQKAKKVAINAIDPIYADDNQIRGFNVRLEGPPRHMSYLNRLLSDANLKVS
jgi:uncharacterized protein (DUF1778 family)